MASVSQQTTVISESSTTTSSVETTSTIPPLTTIPFEPLSASSRLGANGIGGVLVGMTLDQGSTAAGTPLVLENNYAGNGQCAYADPQGGPYGLRFMVIGPRITRVDVSAGSIATLSGVQIGSSEAAVLQAYGTQITTRPHPYNSYGHYLVYMPRSPSLSAYEVIFETDGQRVTSFRSGYKSAVEAIEGCA